MENKLNKIETCEVCGNNNLLLVLDLGLHPMCDDLVAIGDTRECKEYPIEILYCENCFTAHQRFQVPKQDLFPSTYHYRSRFTADVLNGMASLVDSCEKRFSSLVGKKVLDIGCNDGSLLDFFRNKGAVTIGIEPTDAWLDARERKHITYNNYLSKEIAERVVSTHGSPDFITFTNVFAHIENLKEVLDTLKILMSERTVIVIENHYLGAVLDGNQFDTFYHEHPRTYSYRSFLFMAKSLGLEPLEVEFPSRYGGNIRVFLGNAAIHGSNNVVDKTELNNKESLFFERFETMRQNIKHWNKTKQQFLTEQFNKFGKLKGKAFPGRAAILVKLLNLNDNIISAVYEKPGSLKIGYYLPGTRIPIKSDDDLFALEDKTQPILNLAWHIPKEIHNYLSENKYTGPIVDILGKEDFSSSNN